MVNLNRAAELVLPPSGLAEESHASATTSHLLSLVYKGLVRLGRTNDEHHATRRHCPGSRNDLKLCRVSRSASQE